MTLPSRTRGALAAVLTLGALSLAAAPATASGTPDPGLEQQVGGGEVTAADRAVVGSGHVDVGPRFVDGRWRLQARDDRSVPAVWRSTADTVLQVTDAGAMPAPDSPDYGFLGADPGATVHVVPQVQAPDVVWVGWNTQDPEVVSRIDRGATLTLHGIQGPGDVHVFLQEGVAGAPNPLWDSTGALPQDIWMDVNTHVHANWVFTQPGVYLLDVEVSADLSDGDQVSDRSLLRFAIGDATDPQEAMTAALAGPAPTTPAPEDEQPTAPAPENETAADSSGIPAPVVGALVGVGIAIVLVAVVSSVLVTRRRRAQVEAEFKTRSDAGPRDGTTGADGASR